MKCGVMSSPTGTGAIRRKARLIVGGKRWAAALVQSEKGASDENPTRDSKSGDDQDAAHAS
jgi:hypothetical protein